MLQRLRTLLTRDDAIHLAGAQLALGLVLSATLAIAAVPQHRESARLMSARLTPVVAATAQIQAQIEGQGPAQPVTDAPDAGVIRLQDLTPDQARRWNADHPIAKAPNPPAKPFHLDGNGVIDEARALDCMTAAIYYEAGFESTDGQRAVAQVVLNRMRHPAFAKSVCGVVFEGAERKTGCQFTFTCDGALNRGKPDEAAWTRARKVAEAALNGYVMKKVGEATHYHAEYVAPYWSPTLVKVAVVGQHIFYRWTGTWGAPPAFGARYAGGEGTGVKLATLDNLGKAGTKAAILSANTTAAPTALAAHAADAPPTQKAVVAEKPTEPMVTAQAATAEVGQLVKSEDLDWAGRPKARTQPRVAMPGPGGPGRAY